MNSNQHEVVQKKTDDATKQSPFIKAQFFEGSTDIRDILKELTACKIKGTYEE